MEERHTKSIQRLNPEAEEEGVQESFCAGEETARNDSAGASTSRGQARYSSVELQATRSSPVLQDRSDEDESDHAPDQYSQQIRGGVSPSPYTANTERARLFNGYVRGLIETKLDILVPISHQPRELIQEIIADASKHFPEFASCARKRIRTYLKSYRRSKRVKDLQPSSLAGPQSVLAGPEVNSIVPSLALTKESTPVQASRLQGSTTKEVPVDRGSPAVVTINADAPTPLDEEKPPDLKKPRILTPPANCSASISTTEVLAVRQLIQGYRESALFLSRAADQLEQMLTKDESNST